MRQINPGELISWTESGREFVLVDVREEYEHEHFNIGGALIPLGELMGSRTNIPKAVPVVIYCEKGIRSVIAIQRLEAAGFDNLYNLEGGIKAWRKLKG